MWTWTEPLFLLNYMYMYTHTLSQETVSKTTLSNTLGHQFQRRQVNQNKCDVCGETTLSWEDVFTCTRESLHPPLLSSPFFFLLPLSFLLYSLLFFLILPSPSSFLCFPSSHLTPPSFLTECEGTVHAWCKDKLDKTCSEVSEGVWVCEGRGGHKVGGSEGVQVGDGSEGVQVGCESEGTVTVCVYICMCVHACVCIWRVMWFTCILRTL